MNDLRNGGVHIPINSTGNGALGGTNRGVGPNPGDSSSGGNSTVVNNTTPTNNTFGGGTSLQGIAAAIAAGANAHQLYKDADLYTNKSEQYAKQLDPFGSYRDAAAQKLMALQKDPSSIANTPGYQFALQQGLGSVANRDARRFGVGAGSTDPDLMTFAQGLASKTYNDTIKQYQDQAGVGIGPQTAGGILASGLSGSIAARTAATGALASIPGTLTNPTVSGTGGQGSSLIDQAINYFTPSHSTTTVSDAIPDTTTTAVDNTDGFNGRINQNTGQ